jgi:hypothetical protein
MVVENLLTLPLMIKKIIKADALLKKFMFERLKYFSLKGAIEQYRKLKKIKSNL